MSTSCYFEAFPDIGLHVILLLQAPILTKYTEGGDNSLELLSKTVRQESTVMLSNSYPLTILDESLGKLSSYSLQYFIKEGCKNAFASVGLFSFFGSTQSNLWQRRFACHLKAKNLEMETKKERKKAASLLQKNAFNNSSWKNIL